MTCKELHDCLEDWQDLEVDCRSFTAEVVEHVGTCPGCKALVEQRRALGTDLRQVRNSLPEIPTWLDDAVLAGFHKHTPVPAALSNSTPLARRTPPLGMASYAGALLAAALVFGFLLLPGKKTSFRTESLRTALPAVASELPEPASRNASQHQFKRAALGWEGKRDKRVPSRASLADGHDPLPPGFTSLMYCDQLSCAGVMEIVRVQLSPSMMGLPPGPTDRAETVFADVLDGPDGIARGIRIVQ